MNGTSTHLINKFRKFKDKKYRHIYLKAHVRVGIASQIHLLRNKLNVKQSQLAESIGTKQSVISRLEDPDYGNVNLSTLFKVAEAFDVGLLVKFVSFGKFFNESQEISPEELTVFNYSEEFEYLESKLDTKNNTGDHYSNKYEVDASPQFEIDIDHQVATSNVYFLNDYKTAKFNDELVKPQFAEVA